MQDALTHVFLRLLAGNKDAAFDQHAYAAKTQQNTVNDLNARRILFRRLK